MFNGIKNHLEVDIDEHQFMINEDDTVVERTLIHTNVPAIRALCKRCLYNVYSSHGACTNSCYCRRDFKADHISVF